MKASVGVFITCADYVYKALNPTNSEDKKDEMEFLSKRMGKVTVAAIIPRDLFDKNIVPYMKLEDVCSYGRTDHRGARVALIEVQTRGYSWLPKGKISECEAARHLASVRAAVKCGQARLLRFLTSPGCGSFEGCTTLEEVLSKKDITSRITSLTFFDPYSPLYPMLLPPELDQFPGLTHLFCAQTSLKMVSPVVVKCEKLVELNLRSNKLTTVPSYIGKCKNLECLLLADNNLCTLPLELNECETLKQIEVSGNPLKETFKVISKLFPDKAITYEDSDSSYSDSSDIESCGC